MTRDDAESMLAEWANLKTRIELLHDTRKAIEGLPETTEINAVYNGAMDLSSALFKRYQLLGQRIVSAMTQPRPGA